MVVIVVLLTFVFVALLANQNLEKHQLSFWVLGGLILIFLILFWSNKWKKRIPEREKENGKGAENPDLIKGEPATPANTEEAPYVSELAKYYRDFLETSFHKRKEPKRAIRYRDQKNYLLGFNAKKYEQFSDKLWRTILSDFLATEEFRISRGQFISGLPVKLQQLIFKQVEGLDEDKIRGLEDEVIVAINKAADTYKLRPLDASVFALADIIDSIKKKLVTPFLTTVSDELISQSSWGEDILEIVEDNLTDALLFPLREEIPDLVNSLIVGESINVQDRFTGIFNLEFVQSTLRTFFADLSVNDLYLNMQELMRNERLLDKQEIYLYFCDISFDNNRYPIFYIPLHLDKIQETIKVTFDSSVFINKKAIDYIVQEFKRLREKGGAPAQASERILYLEEEGAGFPEKIQKILTDILEFFELGEIILTNPASQIATGMGMSVSNACHICIFDKSDEAIINDYEEILVSLKTTQEVTGNRFGSFVTHFIEEEPLSFKEEVEEEWEDLPATAKLVYQSPVPLNEEQRKILSALKREGCKFISVQGPPGTGKSHAITAVLCDAILGGKSVLMLSDKKEALDVVEDKVTEVINSIRWDDDFQNPILRLGKAGSTYTQILSPDAIAGIEEHYRASRRTEGGREEQILNIETEIRDDLHALGEGYRNINLRDIKEFVSLENELQDQKLLFINADEINDTSNGIDALQFLKKQFDWFNLYFGNQGKFIDIKEMMSQLEVKNATRKVLDLFVAYLSIAVELNAEIKVEDKKGKSFKALALFRHFHTSQLSVLEHKLRECDSLKGSFRGFLWARVWRRNEIKKLTESFFRDFATNMRNSILDNYNTLNAAFDVFQKAMKKKPVHLIGTEEGLDYLRTIHWLLAEWRLRLYHIDTNKLRSFFKTIDEFEQNYPTIFLDLGIRRDEGQSYFENKLALLSETDFTSLIKYFSLHFKYKNLFEGLPKLDFHEKKKRLETLITERMAHRMDGQVVKFSHESRATAQALRGIIRKKQKFPREDFPKLKDAFPCIIAGIRDFSDYIPLEVELFDIVIIDEASQVSVAQALPAIVRGKKVLVLGDTKQFSNLQSSLAKSEVNQERLNTLKEVFGETGQGRNSQLERLKKLDIRTSILELFESIANCQITLVKHSRGYREHISYSSKQFYNGRLQALKIRMKAIDEVLKIDVLKHDGKTEKFKNTNQMEIEAIKTELNKLRDSESGGTIGIITPFHDQQIRLSDEVNRMPDRDYFFDKRKLKIMTFDTCQGEERDTVLYSMVANPSEDKLSYIFPRDLTRRFYDEEAGKIKVQRLNVGFSRAKECMHFFLSKPVEEFKGAIGSALLHFEKEIEEGRRLPETQDTDPASPMEPKVLEWIKNTNFFQENRSSIELKAQFRIGEYLKQLDRAYNYPQYRTDFLLWYKNSEGQEFKIIIEYDGFHHFVRSNEWTDQVYYSDKDLEREKSLESYGYKFLRLNRFNLGKDPVATLDYRLRDLTA